jgi:hypothetical protein
LLDQLHGFLGTLPEDLVQIFDNEFCLHRLGADAATLKISIEEKPTALETGIRPVMREAWG